MAIVKHSDELKTTDLAPGGYAGVHGRVLLGPADGWDSYVMRQFDVAAGGATGHHKHPHPHYVYILEGSGTLVFGDTEERFQKGDTFVIPGDIMHQLKNDHPEGDATMRFMCIVPKEGHQGF